MKLACVVTTVDYFIVRNQYWIRPICLPVNVKVSVAHQGADSHVKSF
jgi:hypothetical protein